MKIFTVGGKKGMRIESEIPSLPETGAFWVVRSGISGSKDKLPVIAIYNYEQGVKQFLKWCAYPWHGLDTLVFLAAVTVERVDYENSEAAKGIISSLAKEFFKQ